MDKGLNKVFYIDIFNGIVKEGSIIENENDGLWLKLKGESMNTFVYADLLDKIVYKQKDDAETALVKIRAEKKTRLLQNNFFINDICEKLEQHEGKLYTEIVKEILQEKN